MFDQIQPLSMLVPLLPLAATFVVAVMGKRWLKDQSHWPIVVSFVAAFLVSVRLLSLVIDGSEQAGPAGFSQTTTLWKWVDVDEAIGSGRNQADFDVRVSLRADPLTCIMLCMVTFIASLIAVYAAGYMHGDPGYWRFFSYIGLFVFSMTMLVSVSNFLLLYIFWEAVGVCSYLLIGFWFQKPEAAAAGKKAFLVNRIGDFGFALGVFLIWTTYHTLDYDAVFGGKIFGGTVGTAIALLLFVGACGKSAQFPLHVWLPDAMEGPTPVSALIHAATMVTAGVYMVARCTPLYAVSEIALVVVACTGAFTALLAGLTALTQNDLKRVMAYSTVSQLGYMFLGLGCGTLAGITGGMFHLFTHAFFKALLFLGAGSVMHAMHHVIDMRRFSGLRHIMPWTHRTFWFGCLALAGVFPFAGFFSKDMILGAVHDKMHDHDGAYHQVYQVLYYGGLFVAFLTAFYTFRELFLTFFGPLKTPAEAHHPHESPRVMTVPLVVLAICAVAVGAYVETSHAYTLLWHTPSLAVGEVGKQAAGLLANHGHLEMHMEVAALSTIVALAGIGLAAFMYLGKRTEAEQVAEFTSTKKGLWLYRLSLNKFYFDELYAVFIVWPLRGLAWLSYVFDRLVIDGLVNFCGWVPRVFGALFRSLQTGMVQFYALAMVLGMLVLFASLRFTALFRKLMNPLVVSIFLPLVGIGLIALLADGSRVVARWIALAVSLITMYWAAKCVLAHVPPSLDAPWFAASGVDIRFSLGLDGLSMWMFGLSALLSITSILVSWDAIEERGPLFYGMLLLLETGMLGVFAARDVILFYVFFEFTLIPLFFLIGIWGSEQRRYAAIKFFLFTLAGSLLTFLGMLAIVFLNARNSGGALTFSIPAITAGLAAHPLSVTQQLWIFLALFAGFAIKVPLFPFHTWLPLAHVQAPTAGSVLLAGILLKIGTYGFLRFSMPMLPDATITCMPWLLWLSAAGIIYGALTALAQSDVKRLIAYSSVSHLGYCMLGLFALNRLGMQGGVLQMINHGLSTGGLFAVFGMIYERYHTREIKELGGLARRIPLLSLMMLLFTFSSIGLPGLNGFAGEFMILAGMFQRGYVEAAPGMQTQWIAIAVLGVFGVILGAWYMLWLYQRVFFGPLKEPHHEGDAHAHAGAHGHDAHQAHSHDDHEHAADVLPPSHVRDLTLREFFALAPLVVFMFWIGLQPQTFLAPMQADVNKVSDVVVNAFARHPWPVAATAAAAPADATNSNLAQGESARVR